LGQHGIDLMVSESDRERVGIVWNDLLNGKGGFHSTNDNCTKDGRTITCDWNNTPLVDKSGTVCGVASLVQDITERKRAEQKLREERERAQNYLDIAGVMMVALDSDGTIALVNRKACEVLGYSEKELIGGNWFDTCLPERMREQVKEVAKLNLSSAVELVEYYENPVLTKSGEERLIAWHNTASRNDDGKITGLLSSGEDITERKHTEERLEDSERRSRAWLQNSSVCTKVVDLDLNLQFMSKAGIDALKIDDVTKLYGKPYPLAFYPESFRNSMTKKLKQAKATGETIIHEAPIVDVDGNELWYHSTIVPVNDEVGQLDYLLVLSAETTERRQAEEALLASEERFRTLMIQAPLVMEIYDLDGLQVEVNETYEKLWGFPSSTTVNKFNVLSSKEVEDSGLMEYVKRAYAGEAVTVPEYEFDPTGETESGGLGRVRWLSTKVYPLKNASGQVTSIVITHEDISDRRQAEENLEESEENFRRLFEHSNDPIFVHSLEGQILDVNNRACEMLGFSHEQLLSMTISSLHPRNEECKYAEAISIVKQKGFTVFETCLTAADGRVLDVSISSKIVDPKHGVVQCIVRDITETKRLQALESRAERLETAGTIAGQVAHDFNNLLAPLMAYPEFIREELPRNHPALTFIDQIETASQKIADINQDLLTMGRRGHYNQRVLNLNTVVQHALSELGTLPETLACQANLAEDLMDIRGGGAQLHRMITNLLHNAKDAMLNIGKLTITTENFYADDVSVAYGLVPKGEYIKLTVADTGCGIPDDIVQKIFDPFFTSKTTDKRRGSGLGMSVVDAVIKDHNGYIDLDTRVGKGTSFYVYFPITRESIDSQNLDAFDGGNESILIVDDDDVQREVSLQLLQKLGYEVSTAESGEKAIEFIRNNSQDLLILDMVMPGGIDGAETYRRILKTCPGQKAIILSGFSESERVLEAQRLGAGSFVSKPLTRNVIAAAVRRELDRKQQVTTA
jgi:PAS domain S-box-containing protein